MKRKSHLNPSLQLTTSITVCPKTIYYTRTYIYNNNTYRDTFCSSRIENLNVFYSLHFYQDSVKFCLKSNINQMFTIPRTKTMSLIDFINKNKTLIFLLNQSNIIVNVYASLYDDNSIKDVNKFIDNLSINLFIDGLGNKLIYNELFHRYYVRYKHIRRAVSALQKIKYLKYNNFKNMDYCIYKDDN